MPLVALAATADCPTSTLHLSEPPYENYFLSDCRTSSHVIVTSPVSGGRDLDPRLLIAWPAGSSGIAAYFAPENGQKGSLSIHLENSTTTGQALESLNLGSRSKNSNLSVGVSGLIYFDSPAILTLPILGSTRAIRDYSEGGTLHPEMQNGVKEIPGNVTGGAMIYRDWFDNTTTTWLEFTQSGDVDAVRIIPGDKYTLRFGKGTYNFRATFNYPQLEQLSPQELLSPASSGLIAQNPDQTTSLSFLSYKNKLLAGTWRFLTYFGRDSMISTLLLQSVLSEGEGGAIEAAIAAALERINKTDGTVCHEEIIGDYATWLNKQDRGINSAAPSCDYKMVDTDYFLPIVMKNYFTDTEAGKSRVRNFLNTQASFLQENEGTAYRKLFQATAEKIILTSAPFAINQTIGNLIHLKDGQSVGQWRDSGNGLGGGRIPYDVNTALIPAALRAIAALSRSGIFENHDDWKTLADQYAQVWEDKTLDFFKVSVPAAEARNLVNMYVNQSGLAAPSQTDKVSGDIIFHGLALNGDNNQPIVRVMNTDDCYRHFLLNTTDQTQLSAYLEQTANNILAPYPVGLSTEAGLIISNPAYGGSQNYANNWSNNQYHGTVIWSWQLAMMAVGLQRQLDRCKIDGKPGKMHLPYLPYFHPH
jgi:hypothetical protein